MKTIFSYFKDSYNFNERQKKILIKIIYFFREYIPNKELYFLYDIDIKDIKFKWSAIFNFNNQNKNIKWFYIFSNIIFLKFPLYHIELYNICIKKILKYKRLQKYVQIARGRRTFNNLKNRNYLISKQQKNLQDLTFFEYLFEQNVLVNIFQQLYKKYNYQDILHIIKKIFGRKKKLDLQVIKYQINQFYRLYNRYTYANAYIIHNTENIQNLYLKNKLTQEQIEYINKYQDNIRVIKQFKNTDLKMKKFVYQLIEYCKEI